MYTEYYNWLEKNKYVNNLATGRKMVEDLYFEKIKDSVSSSRDSYFEQWDMFLLAKLRDNGSINLQYLDDKLVIQYDDMIYDTRSKYNRLADVLNAKYSIDKMKTLQFLQNSQNAPAGMNESPNKVFVEVALRHLGVEFDSNGILVGRIFSTETSPVKYDELLTKIYTMVDREVSVNDTALKRDYIKNQLDDMLSQMYENKKNAIKDILRHTAKNDALLDSAAKAILRCGKIEENVANIEII